MTNSETEYVCLALVIMAVAISFFRQAVFNKKRNAEQIIEVLEFFLSGFERGITVAGVEYKSAKSFDNQVIVEKAPGPGRIVKLRGLGKRDGGQHFMIEASQEIGRGYQGYKPTGLVLKEITDTDARQFVVQFCSGTASEMFQAAIS